MKISDMYVMMIIILNGFILLFGLHIFELSLSVWSFPVVFMSIASIYLSSPRRHTSAAFIYGVIFSVFHLGAAVPIQFGMVLPGELELSISRWYFQHETKYAIELSLVALYFYSIGIYVSRLGFYNVHNIETCNKNEKKSIERVNFNKGLRVSAQIVYFFGLITWVISFVMFFGFGITGVNYEKYQMLVEINPIISWSYLFMGYGITILMATSDRFSKSVAVYSFFIWSIPAFLLGLRGEVLFPLSVMFVLWARSGVKISLRRILIISLIFLSAASIVRQLRVDGFSLDGIFQANYNPAASLVELGSSLRPVVEVINWRNDGDEFIYGASYWAPFERMITKFIPFIPRIDAEHDDRLMNVLVDARVGPIGFSPVAEAFRNFGYIGVVGFFFLLGFLISKLDKLKSNCINNALVAIFLFALIMQVRNAFTPVPAQILFGLSLVLVSKIFVIKDLIRFKIN